MSEGRFSIGIDLGTTNCALAAVALGTKGAVSEVIPVPQWESASAVRESDTLPSFLYRPAQAEEGALLGKTGGGEWVVGRFARVQTTRTPGRVVHSAKSWLCSHGMDRSQGFLPWGSDDLAAGEKISPIRASALLLSYLRDAWNERHPEAPFSRQLVTVTVPASFDAAAQKLTLDAARDGGFPDQTRLLEEPQAVFYRWLEAHEGTEALEEKIAGLRERPHHVLVVDVGGGTSDFSLFEIRLGKRHKLPRIRRVAVSDHILLGGDNIDLALAHLVEPRFGGEGLSREQWGFLLAQCREAKERILEKGDAGGDGEGEAQVIAIPGRGAGLLGSTLRAELGTGEVRDLVLNGFFPSCDRDAEPEENRAALREMGLAYAADSGVTRYLSTFLRGNPKIDAVLFNGGTLQPEALRRRIVELVAEWQGGGSPVVLDNPEPALAVARGAARYGLLLHENVTRIEAGAARSLYLAAEGGEESALVCVLPKGTPQEEEVRVDALDLRLRVNQPVHFRVFSSTRRADAAGSVVRGERLERDFFALPVLETLIQREDAEAGEVRPVVLSSRLNALGLLQIDCVDGEDASLRWPLRFHLREGEGDGKAEDSRETTVLDPGVDAMNLEAARERIRFLFQHPWNKRDALTPARLVQSLERILEQGKGEWNAALLRALWPALWECFEARGESFEHEESWVSFAGLILRPGYGVQLDEHRIDQLWRFHDDGFWYPGKAMQLDADMLWRRVAGGLDRERQEVLCEEALPRVAESGKKIPAEAVRLLGALERLDAERKMEICEVIVERAEDCLRENRSAEPYWAALGLLLNRAPAYAGAETVPPPDLVESLWERVRELSWEGPERIELRQLFLRAARVVDDRTLDVPKGVRQRIAAKLRKAEVPENRILPLERHVALRKADKVSLFGEALPPGLVLP